MSNEKELAIANDFIRNFYVPDERGSLPYLAPTVSRFRAASLLNTFAGSLYTNRCDRDASHKFINDFMLSRGFLRFEKLSGMTDYIQFKDGTVNGVSLFNNGAHEFNFGFSGDKETVEQIQSELTEQFKSDCTVVAIVEGVDPIKDTVKVSHTTLAITPYDPRESLTYPFLNVSIQDLGKGFMASKKNAALLIGPPGTGKSTLLRKMISSINAETLLVNSKSLITLQTLAFFRRSKFKLLVVEDADGLLMSRTEGNEIMSELLNFTDGIITNDKKIILSTNLESVSRVDDAILRPGRAYAVLKFRHLLQDEAIKVAEAFGITGQDLTTRDKWTLAETLNPPEEFDHSEARVKHKTGF